MEERRVLVKLSQDDMRRDSNFASTDATVDASRPTVALLRGPAPGQSPIELLRPDRCIVPAGSAMEIPEGQLIQDIPQDIDISLNQFLSSIDNPRPFNLTSK